MYYVFMSHDFYQNLDCKYFPCHKGIKEEEFSCLFCFCPLYALEEECGGNFDYNNEKGIKNCTYCLVPHKRSNYEHMIEKSALLVEKVRKKRENRIIYESFAGFFDEYSSRYDYSFWLDYLKKISGIDNLKSKNILELGCGTGEILTRFAKAGANVCGVDVSGEMLSYADEKFFSAGLNGLLLKSEMSEFSTKKEFDFIFSMGDSVNYLDEHQLRKLFINIHSMLSDGASFTFDLINFDIIGQIDTYEEVTLDDALLIFRREVTDHTLFTTVEIQTGEKTFSELHKQYFYTSEQLFKLADECGYSCFDEWGIFTFNKKNETDEKVQYRVRK